MSVQVIDNFQVNVALPVDNRIVVGTGFTYTTRTSIPYPYRGMRIYDTNNSVPYVYNGSTWSFDIDKVAITDDLTSTALNFIPFVAATSDVQSVKTSSTRLRFQPSTGRLQFADGSVTIPTLSFAGTGTKFVGIYKSSVTSLAVAVNDSKIFEIGSTGVTSSQRFNVTTSTLTSNFGDGGVRFGRPTGVFPSFEFFSGNPNSRLSIYNLAPTQIVAGYSNTTTETTGLQFDNYTNYSVNIVRDRHYINAESSRGVISFGNSHPLGFDNDQFILYMKNHTTSTANNNFDYDGGGLAIGYNFAVNGTTRLGSTVSISGDTFLNEKTLYLQYYPYYDDETTFDTIYDESYLKYTSSHAGYSIDGPLLSGRASGSLGTSYWRVGRATYPAKVALHWSYQGNVGIGTASLSNNRLRIIGEDTLTTKNTLRVQSLSGLDYFVVRNDGNSSFGTPSVTGTRLLISGNTQSSDYAMRVTSSTGSFNFGIRNDGNSGFKTLPDSFFTLKVSGPVNIEGDTYLNSNTLYLKSTPTESLLDILEGDECFVRYSTGHGGYSLDGTLISGRLNGALGTGETEITGRGGGVVPDNVALHWSYQGNVGIGTSSVSGTRLRIQGDSTPQNLALRVLNSSGVFNFGVRNDGNTGIGVAPDDTHALKVSGLGSTGSVLITSDTWTSGSSASLYIGDTNSYIRNLASNRFEIKSTQNVFQSSDFNLIFSAGGFNTMIVRNNELSVYVHNRGGTGSNAAQALTSGEYTPTYGNLSNISATFSVSKSNYMRVGNVVHVSGRYQVDPITTTHTSFSVSLPTLTDFFDGSTDLTYLLTGVATVHYSTSIAQDVAYITGSSSDKAIISWYARTITAGMVYYTFQYSVTDASSGPGFPIDPPIDDPL